MHLIFHLACFLIAIQNFPILQFIPLQEDACVLFFVASSIDLEVTSALFSTTIEFNIDDDMLTFETILLKRANYF